MQAAPGLAAGVDWRLYHVTDTTLSGGLDRVPGIVERAVLGGAGVIQVRDKDVDDEAFIRLTRGCLDAVERASDATGRRAAVVVNDRLAIAERFGLHFHQGQSDGDVREARTRLGRDALIGLSISNRAQLLAELAAPTADVLGLSPIWATPRRPTPTPPSAWTGPAPSSTRLRAGGDRRHRRDQPLQRPRRDRDRGRRHLRRLRHLHRPRSPGRGRLPPLHVEFRMNPKIALTIAGSDPSGARASRPISRRSPRSASTAPPRSRG
ncbi:thiamine phosphate synthase [Tessaracoccus coleopterorum]|nr:thiamine phosphate synthase [Tessaracoccus coleopterorum]